MQIALCHWPVDVALGRTLTSTQVWISCPLSSHGSLGAIRALATPCLSQVTVPCLSSPLDSELGLS